MAQCSALTKSGNQCVNPVIHYGVCRRHKDWAYDGGTDPEVLRYIQEYATIVRQFHDALRRCDTAGTDVQSHYQFNLTQTLDPATLPDPDSRDFVTAVNAMRDRIEAAKQAMDPNLACNLQFGVNSILLGGANCQRSPLEALVRSYVQPYLA